MQAQVMDKTELLASIDEVFAQLLGLMASLDKNDVNRIPYKGSWTAAELFRHLIKSTDAVEQAMGAPGNPPQRDPGEKIDELKKIFLDFSQKLKSPDFIIPERGFYEKQAIMEELHHSVEKLNTSANNADLNRIIDRSPVGPASKLEMLHFVWYHTQRHLHQMRKICAALQVSYT